MTGNHGGLIGSQVSKGRADLAGVDNATNGDHAQNHLAVLGIFQTGASDLGQSEGGSNYVYGDAVLGPVKSQSAGQGLNAALGGAVRLLVFTGMSNEPGVLSASECFYPSVSPLAKELFFYMTRYGHYYCDTKYCLSDNSAIAQLEGHQNYFLYYVKSGKLNIENDGKFFTATAGQAGIVDCRKPHKYYAVEPLEYYWLHFDGVLAKKFCDKIIESHDGSQVFNPSAGKQIEQNYNQLLNQLRSNSLNEAEITQIIYRVLCQLLIGFYTDFSNTQDKEALDAVHYIKKNFANSITVEDVAAQVNLSYSYFSRRFKAFTGHSIHSYITICRLSEAKHLLASTDMSMKEIAFSIGYHSESNFIVSFTTQYGCSPSEYRRHYSLKG